MNPITRPIEVDHDERTVTFAVTFRWRRPWALDHCEVGSLRGDLTRLLCEHYESWEQLAGLVAVETWEPLEERHIGNPGRYFGNPPRFEEIKFPDTNE